MLALIIAWRNFCSGSHTRLIFNCSIIVPLKMVWIFPLIYFSQWHLQKWSRKSMSENLVANHFFHVGKASKFLPILNIHWGEVILHPDSRVCLQKRSFFLWFFHPLNHPLPPPARVYLNCNGSEDACSRRFLNCMRVAWPFFHPLLHTNIFPSSTNDFHVKEWKKIFGFYIWAQYYNNCGT